jgi:type IV secretory pathway VirB2 component (pilin)
MATPDQSISDDIRLSVRQTRHDLRISLALLYAGIAVSIVFFAFSAWANHSGYSAEVPATSLVYSLLGSIGGTLILTGAIFVGVNWSLLRKMPRVV